MDMRRIGSLVISAVGLGTNNFGARLDYAGTDAVVGAALDAGVTFIDTADVYGGTRSEEFLGRALSGRRHSAVLATKFGLPIDQQRQGARPAYVRQAVDDSLRRLATDRIDLYQLHRPDPDTPIADTLGALDDLVQAGKIREIGCSNFSASQLREAATAASGSTHFVSVQNEYSLLHREPEPEVLAACAELDVAFLPFFPLASGLLTGKYAPGVPPPADSRLSRDGWAAARFLTGDRLDVAHALNLFAQSRGHSLLELAISWLMMRPMVASVIVGASSPEQVHANVRAVGWQLTEQDLAEIDRIAPAP